MNQHLDNLFNEQCLIGDWPPRTPKVQRAFQSMFPPVSYVGEIKITEEFMKDYAGAHAQLPPPESNMTKFLKAIKRFGSEVNWRINTAVRVLFHGMVD